jgi:hypothetical protein
VKRFRWILLAWWFLLGSSQFAQVVGPFDNEQLCNDTRREVSERYYVSKRCWHGEVGYRP